MFATPIFVYILRTLARHRRDVPVPRAVDAGDGVDWLVRPVRIGHLVLGHVAGVAGKKRKKHMFGSC